MSMPITQHFSIDEFACRDGSAYPVDEVDDDDAEKRSWYFSRLLPLCNLLEAIRTAAGDQSITIDSGYRSLAYDQKLYDAESVHTGLIAAPQGSQHPKGRAADITHATLSPADLHWKILQAYDAGQLPMLGGIGLYKTFVHVDVRPQDPPGHLAQWGGARDSNIA